MSHQYYYCFFLASLLFLLAPRYRCGQVFSWNSQVTYRSDGNVQSIRLHFSLESGLASGRYIHIRFPFLLGTLQTDDIPSGYVYEYNKRPSATSKVLVKNEAGSKDYFFIIPSTSAELLKNTWYTLEVFTTRQIVATAIYQDPIVFMTTSAFEFGGGVGSTSPIPSPDRIIYDFNYAFGQLTVLAIPRYTALQTNAEFETANMDKRQGFGQTNVVFFDIQPTVSTKKGAAFFISLSPPFQFSTTCISVAATTSEAINIDALEESTYTCAVDTTDDNNNILRITRLEDIQANKKFRIKAFVINPYVVAQGGYSVYYYEIDESREPVGQIVANSIIANKMIFQTNPVVITAQPFRVLWGFSTQTGGHSFLLKSLYTSGVSLPIAAGDDNGCYVYNNVQIFFTVSKNTPSDSTNLSYTLRLRLQNTGILDGSIRHNLPDAIGSGCFCKDESNEANAIWLIVCRGMGALQTSKNYFIAAKIWFKRNHIFDATSNTDFGRVSIEGVTRNNDGTEIVDTTLFTSAPGVTLTSNSFIQSSIYAGQHATSGFALYLGKATQIISVKEDALYNGDPLAALWSKINTKTTGVVAKQQQATTDFGDALIFLLQATTTQTCGDSSAPDFANCNPAAANYKYQQVKMELYFNSQVISFDSGKEQSAGLHLGAFQSSAITETGPHCIDSSQCVNYVSPSSSSSTLTGRSVKNGIDYNYKEIFNQQSSSQIRSSDTLSKLVTPDYGRYTFFCGDNAKSSQSDVQKCIFDGKLSQIDHENTIFALRRVKYASSFFHSSLYADDSQALDFVIGFFSGQMDCNGDPCSNAYQFKLASASVLHAYTITDLSAINNNGGQPFSGIYAGYVNYWRNNDGKQVPTLLRVRGKLTTSEIPAAADTLAVFFDNNVALEFLVHFGEPSATITSQNLAIKHRRSNEYYCSAYKSGSSPSIASQTHNQCEMLQGTSQEETNNWRMSTGIIFRDFVLSPEEFFDLYVPIATKSTLDSRFLTLVFFKSLVSSITQGNSALQGRRNSQYQALTVIKLKGGQGGDLITKIQPFTASIIGFPDISAALSSRGQDSGGKYFSYGVQQYDLFTRQLQFKASPTASPATNLDFSSKVNTALNGYGAGLTIISKGVDIFLQTSTQIEMSNSDGQSTGFDRSKQCRKIIYKPGYNQRVHYSVFCPFDAGVAINANTFSAGNTDISVSVEADLPISFYVQNVFTYGISVDTGAGHALNYEIGKQMQPSEEQLCSLLPSTQQLYSFDVKPQIFSLPINLTNPLPVDNLYSVGTASVQIEVAFQPGSNTQWNLDPSFCQLELYQSSTQCTLSGPVSLISDPNYPANTLLYTATIIFLNTFPSTSVTNLQLNFRLQAQKQIDETYAQTISGQGIPFQIRVLIGNADSSNGGALWIWGDTVHPASKVIWEICGDQGLVRTGLSAPPVLASFYLGDKIMLQSLHKRVPSTMELVFSPGSARKMFPKGDFVEIDLAWASEAQQTPLKYCLVFNDSSGAISWHFDRIQQFSSRLLRIYVGDDISIQQQPQQKYRLSCRFAIVPDPTDPPNSDPIKARWMDQGGSIVVQTSSSQINYNSSLVNPPQPLTVTLASKNFSSPGINAIYNFQLTVIIELNFSSLIYLQFPSSIPSKFNSQEGQAECTLDGVDTFCDSPTDGWLLVQLPKLIAGSAGSPKTFTVTVMGVTQPANTDLVGTSIWVGVSQLGNYASSLDAAQIINEGILTNTANSFPIIAVLVEPNTVRSKIVHQIWTILPKASIVEDRVIYVDFFKSSYAKLWLPVCKVIRTEDTSKYNWAKSCSFLNSQRLVITLRATDGNITTNAKEFLIRIANGPSPVQYHGPTSAKNIIRYQVLIASTNKLYVQDSSYLSSDLAKVKFVNSAVLKNIGWSFFDASGRVQPQQQMSDQNIVKIYKGYFSSRVVLNSFTTSQVQDRFSKVFTVALTGTSAFRFKLKPSVWMTQIDDSGVQVLVGTSSSTIGGSYLLDSFKSSYGDQTYVPIPPVITFIVMSNPCQDLTVTPALVYVPIGGSFDFLRVNFKACIPFKDVTLTGTFATGTFKLGPSDSQTLNSTTNFSNPILLYSIKNIDQSAQIDTPVTLSWTLSGTDGANYLPPPSVQVILVNDPLAASVPNLTINTNSISITQGALHIPVSCNQNGTLFYSAGLNYDFDLSYLQNASGGFVGFQKIWNKLQGGMLEYTDRERFDPSWRVYGMQLIQQDVETLIHISGTKQSSQYDFEAYCINKKKIISQIASVERLTTSGNNGKLSKLVFQFQSPVSLKNKYWLVCALSELLVIKPYLVVNDAGQYCYIGSLNSNTIISSTSQIQFESNLADKSQVTVYFLSDSSISSDTLFTKVQLASQQTTFKNTLYSKIQQLTGDMPLINTIQFIIVQHQFSKQQMLQYFQTINADTVSQDQDYFQRMYSFLAFADNSKPQSIVIDLNQIVFTFKKLNVDGFIIIGIEKALTGKLPSVKQLFFGFNGYNQILELRHSEFMTNDTVREFKFTQLEQFTEYVIYWAIFTEDINPDSENSGIKAAYFLTIPNNATLFNKYSILSQRRLEVQWMTLTILLPLFLILITQLCY